VTTFRDPHAARQTRETPGPDRPGVRCAEVVKGSSDCEGVLPLPGKGRAAGHKGVRVAQRGRYSNRPPDKAVISQ
jgi:hypothetical protein